MKLKCRSQVSCSPSEAGFYPIVVESSKQYIETTIVHKVGLRRKHPPPYFLLFKKTNET